MKKICVVTGARAEYGLLNPLINKMNKDDEIKLSIVVTGSHLSPEYGLTYKTIIADGFSIAKKIDILMSSDSKSAVCKSMGLAMIGFGEYFEENNFDLLVVLGDRYEIFAAASAASVIGIPIAHLHGGEITEGAYDEYFRHCITKMSYLHFTSSNEHRNRVIQLGESPDRVFNVGAIGIENIMQMKLLSKKELEDSLDFKLDVPYGLVTYHPVTIGDACCADEIMELLSALEDVQSMKFIITKANADHGGRIINQIIDSFVLNHQERFVAYTSLGQLRYLSAMKYANVVIGNSSSGIIEAPSFNKPVVDIGNRQKGRVASKLVFNCETNRQSILDGINYVLSDDFISKNKNSKNPYGDGEVSNKILSVIKDYLNTPILRASKSFYDINLNDIKKGRVY